MSQDISGFGFTHLITAIPRYVYFVSRIIKLRIKVTRWQIVFYSCKIFKLLKGEFIFYTQGYYLTHLPFIILSIHN